MAVANGSLKSDAARTQADAHRVLEDLGRAADHAREAFPELARQARDLFDEGVERLRGQVREGGKDARDAAGDGVELFVNSGWRTPASTSWTGCRSAR